MCVRPGMTKNTYGTRCFMLQNTGTEAGGIKEPSADDGGLEDGADD